MSSLCTKGTAVGYQFLFSELEALETCGVNLSSNEPLGMWVVYITGLAPSTFALLSRYSPLCRSSSYLQETRNRVPLFRYSG